MKALILAAGLGTRLSPITDDRPKSLVEVNGQAIIMKQIDNLLKNKIHDITIISGYLSNILEKEVKKQYPPTQYPGINIINSPDYASTNNMYSAFLGRFAMTDSPFLMMNADVFFDSSVIGSLLEFSNEDAIVTDVGMYIEESMKVVQENNRIVKISKEVTPETAYGVSIDVYKFSRTGGASFFNKCYEYIELNKEVKLWSEVALNDILSDIHFAACPLRGRWMEIDNHTDLAKAEEIFTS